MNLPILQSEVKTMSSKDLLDLINKARESANEKPVRLNDFNSRIADELDGEHYEIFVVQNLNNTQSTIYGLTIDQCTLVSMRESKSVRKNVLAQLKALQNQQPQITLPNFTDPAEAAEAWAKEYREKQVLAVTLEQAKPKINFYDKVGDSKNLLIASKIGQSFKTNPMSAVVLNKHLEKFDVYNMSIKSGRVFKQWFVDKGFGRMVQNDNGYPQAKFTTDGQAWIVEKFTSEGVI